MKWNFLYQITAAYRTPDYEAYRPQNPILSVLSPQTNFVEAPPEKNSWVRHWSLYETETVSL